MPSIIAPVLQKGQSEKTSTHMIISPYIDEPHLLDLRTVDTQEQLLAHALARLQCLRDDYATAKYVEAFNWSEVASEVRRRAAAIDHQWTARTFYIVVFRSRIPPTTDYENLGALDKAAHAEAVQSGGFLKYWFGSPDVEGRNMATCVWRSREDAIKGGVGPAHRRAAGAARHNYTEWRIERLALVFDDEVKSWAIEDWGDR